MSKSVPRLLLAVAPQAVQTYLSHLKPDFSVAVCTSIGATRVALKEHFDLVLTSPEFDSSRMFELLRLSCWSGNERDTSVVCVRSYDAENVGLDAEMMRWIVKAYGAKGYVDMAYWIALFGLGNAFSLLRSTLHGTACNYVINADTPQSG